MDAAAEMSSELAANALNVSVSQQFDAIEQFAAHRAVVGSAACVSPGHDRLSVLRPQARHSGTGA